MDVQAERLYALASGTASAGDGIPYDTMLPQPPPAPTFPVSFTGAGSVSAPMMTMVEFIRRQVTYCTSPSATLVSGGSAGSIAITLGANPSGICGFIQGWPFALSALGTPSAALTSLASTASNQIRKVLVTIGMSAMPPASSFALGGGTVQFVYGSAAMTSANGCTSGGQGISYFDYLPLPQASANEIPMGWLNIPNSFATSAGIANSMMFTDWRVTQGVNLSAMMIGVQQPVTIQP